MRSWYLCKKQIHYWVVLLYTACQGIELSLRCICIFLTEPSTSHWSRLRSVRHFGYQTSAYSHRIVVIHVSSPDSAHREERVRICDGCFCDTGGLVSSLSTCLNIPDVFATRTSPYLGQNGTTQMAATTITTPINIALSITPIILSHPNQNLYQSK